MPTNSIALTDTLDLRETLRYLMAVPDNRHTAESVGALIQLARNFEHAAQPLEALQAVSQAARYAAALKEKSLLCAARGLEGITLSHLGRFAEAIMAQVESWSLARDLGNNEREIWATSNLGIHCSGMGQFKVAIHCFERARALAEHHGFADSEFNARVNLAASSVLLRQPAFGLQALSQLAAPAPQTRIDMVDFVCAHHNLARLHLMTGDLKSARAHATESARLARSARLEALGRSTGSTAWADRRMFWCSGNRVGRGRARPEFRQAF